MHLTSPIKKTTFWSIVLLQLTIHQLLGQIQRSDTLALENHLNTLFGVEKLEALNNLSSFYHEKNERKQVRFARQAKNLAEQLFKDNDIPNVNRAAATAFINWGNINYEKEKFYEFGQNVEQLSLIQYHLNDSITEIILADFRFKLDSLNKIGVIKNGFFTKAFSNINLGSIRRGANNLKIKAQLKQASNKEKNQKFLEAINHYQKAIELYENQGASIEITTLHLKIASLYDSLGLHENSQNYLEKVITTTEVAEYKKRSIPRTELTGLSTDSLKKRSEEYLLLSKQFEGERNFKKSLQYFELYQKASKKLFEDSIKTKTQNQLRESEMTLLRQQKNIAALNLEKSKAENEKQIQLKRTYLILGAIALLSSLVAYFLYADTRKKHQKLNLAYKDLDKANEKLTTAEKKITDLLKQQVSSTVANELLKANKEGDGKMIEACILFLDIREFTPMAQQMNAEELIAFQNNAFGPMLDIIQQNNGVVNQLMGDGFMATFGISKDSSNIYEQGYNAAREILKNVTNRVSKKEIRPFKIGMGLHAGPVVVGNVGNKKRKQFSITGNPVIIASRLEQLNKSYNSNLVLSDMVFKQLDKKIKPGEFQMDNVMVKGWSDKLNIHILKA